ncbi:hypothetical protein RJ639_017645 [Escallonia herrerae]|uniref:Retrotransposon gag domain-containing protein n=1 Tax=Escallonia herrerae TaxID=1293975 RepID=A0AA89AK12_9ASTE|nr:hypothetical protein RJ639_017645 [Escallonia herrerae]
MTDMLRTWSGRAGFRSFKIKWNTMHGMLKSRLRSDESVDVCHVLGWICQVMVAEEVRRDQDGYCVINTWDILKRELKSQFFPENTTFNVRKALLECKYTGSVWEYCQAFSALMLDISDMSVVDRLFFFMEGLKPWARTELNRRRVNNLNEAIIAAESLSDYNSKPQRPLKEEIQPEVGNPEESLTGEKPKDMPPKKKGDVPGKGLMYVDIKVNRKAIRAMVDTVRTDNTAMSHFLSQSKLTLKQARWQELLAEFNFMLEYRAGSTNSVADALSKRAKLDKVELMAMNATVRADN